MILAHRAFANHDLLSFLQASNWHYCIRITCDTQLHGIRRHTIEASSIHPKKGEAAFYRNVGLWQDGLIRCNAHCRLSRGSIRTLGCYYG
jgi:hypothetical protein